MVAAQVQLRPYQNVSDGQDPFEMTRFCQVLVANGVRSYLEVGSKWGGSLWEVGMHLLPPAVLATVDLPHGDGRTAKSLVECCAALREAGHVVHSFLGNSTSPEALNWARKLGPFDAIFVDANHTYPYCSQDWRNYYPMALKLIAFHDIAWVDRPGREGRLPIDVPRLWGEIKSTLPREKWYEIRTCHMDNGIGIVFK